MSDPLRVHLLHPPEDVLFERLRARVGDRATWSAGADVDAAPPYEVLVAGVPDEAALDRSPALRALVIPWAGLPTRTAERLRARRHVAVHNIHHNAQATAEMAVALLLAAAKRLIPCDRALRDGTWMRGEVGVELGGKTALVLGYGAVGQRVGAALAGLGMDVVAVRRAARDGAHGVEQLPALLPGAAALVVALPGTDATRGLLGAPQLAALPTDAVLVNVGRADVIDEDALYDALRTRAIGAAGLDVWYRYPDGDPPHPPSAHPFGELDNVVLSPHRAGRTERNERDRVDHLARVLIALADGDAPPRVDLDAGY